MIEHLTLSLRHLVEHHPYQWIVGILYVCGLGVPIPEEVSLLLAGYFAYQFPGRIKLWLMMVLCVSAILAGDMTMFMIARQWGARLLKTRFGAWLFPATRLEKVHRYFDKHGSKTVFFARFLAGIRMPVYFTAGMTKMNPARFVLLDLAGTLISGPTSIFIAWKFADDFDRAMKKVNHANHWIFGGMLVVIVGTIAWHLWKDHRERLASKREKERLASEGVSPVPPAEVDEAAK